jgi:type IV secretory pathway ATPase VirB11/archaellum biosynthesis ATPase
VPPSLSKAHGKPIAGGGRPRFEVEIEPSASTRGHFERKGAWHWIEVPDFAFDRLDAIGIQAGFALPKEFGPADPICLTTLPRGHRFTTCRPPATAKRADQLYSSRAVACDEPRGGQ